MEQIMEIYNLKDDKRRIASIQNASLNAGSDSGLKVQDGLLFGSEEWFKAVETGGIKSHILNGIISKVFTSGHGDFPEFEIETEHGKTSWMRYGIDGEYTVGRKIELTYVEQPYKRPIAVLGPISKCVVLIKVEKH